MPGSVLGAAGATKMLRQGPCPQGAHGSVRHVYTWLQENTERNKKHLPGERAIEVALEGMTEL